VKIVITGASGMLGRALCEVLGANYDIVGLDITSTTPSQFCNVSDQTQISARIKVEKPEIVIHAAAYTNVDRCEIDSKKAKLVNVQGTKNVAQACKNSRCSLVYISTDFVFDGKKGAAYLETDTPNPINVYGESKLEGEKHIQSILEDFFIIRTSSLFGRGGRNFVDAVLNKTQSRDRIKVVNDQLSSPTYVKDLAEAIESLISLKEATKGIYHVTNSGSCSWYELANEIKKIAALKIEIISVSTEQYDSPTERPKMSALDNARYQKCVGKKMRPWQEALKEYILG